MTTSDGITLAGAIAASVAAGLAAVALRKIRDERRRTFRLGLLIDLLTSIGQHGRSEGVRNIP